MQQILRDGVLQTEKPTSHPTNLRRTVADNMQPQTICAIVHWCEHRSSSEQLAMQWEMFVYVAVTIFAALHSIALKPKRNSLEQFDGVPTGKYTIGLGLKEQAVASPPEDICSIALTAVSRLLDRASVSLSNVGRLEVGTETLIDKSKSVKTVLMQLFADSDNHDVQGVDNMNACYGGTAALFNSVAWVESSDWDGRWAVVVAGDIAVYERGPARATGGCGIVAMLVGPDAPLALEPGLRASYFEHAYDFFKPDMSSCYPVVDGPISIACYLRALENCYSGFRQKFERIHARPMDLKLDVQRMTFHTPYVKLVRKAFAQVATQSGLQSEEAPLFESLVNPSVLLSERMGNSYCGSLYVALASVLYHAKAHVGDRILLFSYGSGLASSMFSLQVRRVPDSVVDHVRVTDALKYRRRLAPEQFHEFVDARGTLTRSMPTQWHSYASALSPGVFYCAAVDEKWRRTYARAPPPKL